jgi:hypothetical protein
VKTFSDEKPDEKKKTVEELLDELIDLMDKYTWGALQSIEVAVWILAGSVILGYVMLALFLLRIFHF